MQNKLYIRNILSLLVILVPSLIVDEKVHALGNHPQAGICPSSKPFYTFCSHSLHNLEGWYGDCHKTREQTQRAVNKHAREQHKGNDRWTGILTVNPYQ